MDPSSRFSDPRASSRFGMPRGCLIAVGVAVVLLLVAGMTMVGQYNGLVTKDEKVTATWSEVQNQYKRRYDLVPNLVETVKGAADFERSTLESVVEARAKVGRVQLPDTVPQDPAKLKAFLAAQKGLGAALGRLFAVVERYPQLRATESYRGLQDQLEGTENRIAVARRDFIDSVRAYNTARRRFPANLIAGMFGFEPKAQLAVEAGEQQVPKVDFGRKTK